MNLTDLSASEGLTLAVESQQQDVRNWPSDGHMLVFLEGVSLRNPLLKFRPRGAASRLSLGSFQGTRPVCPL